PRASGIPYGIGELLISPRRSTGRSVVSLARHPDWPWSSAQRVTSQLRLNILNEGDRADLGILEFASMVPCVDEFMAATKRRIFLHQNLQSVTQVSIAERQRGLRRLAWLREARAHRRLEHRAAHDDRFERHLVLNA